MKHVAVLMGGQSAERPVSLASGKACADGLEEAGYRVTRIDVAEDLVDKLKSVRPEVAFNALHGPMGEDGSIQGLLEFLGIPYTHSGVMASALAMDKGRAKAVLAAAGIPVAEHVTCTRFEAAQRHMLPPPYVLKPVAEGSSFGVLIVREGANRPPDELSGDEWPYGDAMMAEKFVDGLELTCGAFGDTVYDIIEIEPVSGAFYGFEAKYAPGGSNHTLPARIKPNIYQDIQKYTLLAHRALGCRGVSRADFRYDPEKDELVCLEVNTQPGMTETSLVPEMAAYAGVSFSALVAALVEDASCRR
ncbi:D-alanine--D-alanine ligase [Acuticoccus sp. MNP-M23]|uniref:D-alanine--D-alanine ligase n=1 Tax=Acuticoccus sp. MNP-M23 TaxID=3072793 RepID=UPI0028154F22|nr:D-alanine--D-alanine ligase [Acuticoccus sp. MNP-M23]WMS40856.1 D-alanine--D-alanine ligase [Acuticoccus sp. MNP-M23]